MNAPSPNIPTSLEKAAGRKKFRRLAIGVFLIVIIAHVVVGLGSAVWIVARYFSKPTAQFVAEKRVDIKPEDRPNKLKMDEVASLRPKPVYNNRIQSLRPSALVLPDIPKMPVETMVTINAEPVISTQLDGVGKPSTGTGISNAKGGFFGNGAASSGLLEGTFYDLKQTVDGKLTDMGAPNAGHQLMMPIIKKFIQNWNPSIFRKYFQGPDKLYSSQLSIPNIQSSVAPKEFGLAGKVKPGFWIVLYQGRVVAPKTGRFRFVGAGDDAMIVRFDRKNVLDAGFWPIYRPEQYEAIDYGFFDQTGTVKGHVVGQTFNVVAGKPYDVEILIGDMGAASDGSGLFQATLFIQDMDQKYRKDRKDHPILPFFKLKPSNLEATVRAKIPPYERDAPIWSPSSLLNQATTITPKNN